MKILSKMHKDKNLIHISIKNLKDKMDFFKNVKRQFSTIQYLIKKIQT